MLHRIMKNWADYLFWGALVLISLVIFSLNGDFFSKLKFGSEPVPVFVSVDFEQGFFDAQSSGVKANPGIWMSSKVEEICEKQSCIILQSQSVLGGDVIDVNKMFRDEFGIETAAEKPSINSEELVKFIEMLEGKN